MFLLFINQAVNGFATAIYLNWRYCTTEEKSKSLSVFCLICILDEQSIGNLDRSEEAIWAIGAV